MAVFPPNPDSVPSRDGNPVPCLKPGIFRFRLPCSFGLHPKNRAAHRCHVLGTALCSPQARSWADLSLARVSLPVYMLPTYWHQAVTPTAPSPLCHQHWPGWLRGVEAGHLHTTLSHGGGHKDFQAALHKATAKGWEHAGHVGESRENLGQTTRHHDTFLPLSFCSG